MASAGDCWSPITKKLAGIQRAAETDQVLPPTLAARWVRRISVARHVMMAGERGQTSTALLFAAFSRRGLPPSKSKRGSEAPDANWMGVSNAIFCGETYPRSCGIGVVDMVNKKAGSLGRWLAGWAVMTESAKPKSSNDALAIRQITLPVFCLARKLNLQNRRSVNFTARPIGARFLLHANARPMQRIVIIGSTGSGKSTLGRTLAAKFVPHTEMDTAALAARMDRARRRPFVSWWMPSPRSRPGVIDVPTAWRAIWFGCGPMISSGSTTAFPAYGMATAAWRTWRRVFDGERCCNGNEECSRAASGATQFLLWLLKTYWRNRRTILGGWRSTRI